MVVVDSAEAAQLRKRATNALAEWMTELDFTHFVTFNFNGTSSVQSARTALKRFHFRIDRKLYGHVFNKLPPERRTFFIGFFEHLQSNTHCHALLRTPSMGFDQLAEETWRKLVPSGQLHISGRVTDGDMLLDSFLDRKSMPLLVGDIRRIGAYITKEAHLLTQNENFVLSTEFSPLYHK